MNQTSARKTSVISDDAPKLMSAHFDRAKFRVDGKVATKSQWQEVMRARITKQRISIMLDAPIIQHFKAVAGERGYQTLINYALRRAVEGEHLADD